MDTWEWRMYWDTTWDTIWVSIDGTPLWNYLKNLRAWYIYLYIYTPQIPIPSLKLTWHLKLDGWNTSFLQFPFGMAYFQVLYVSFREGKLSCIWTIRWISLAMGMEAVSLPMFVRNRRLDSSPDFRSHLSTGDQSESRGRWKIRGFPGWKKSPKRAVTNHRGFFRKHFNFLCLNFSGHVFFLKWVIFCSKKKTVGHLPTKKIGMRKVFFPVFFYWCQKNHIYK